MCLAAPPRRSSDAGRRPRGNRGERAQCGKAFWHEAAALLSIRDRRSASLTRCMNARAGSEGAEASLKRRPLEPHAGDSPRAKRPLRLHARASGLRHRWHFVPDTWVTPPAKRAGWEVLIPWKEGSLRPLRRTPARDHVHSFTILNSTRRSKASLALSLPVPTIFSREPTPEAIMRFESEGASA